MKDEPGLRFENSDEGTTTWDGEDERTGQGQESSSVLNTEL